MSSVLENKKTKSLLNIKNPSLYNVVLHNDDVTTFEFVILILMENFNKSQKEATLLTLEIDNEGKAIVGTYTHEIAITKKQITDIKSKINNFPLVCSLSKE